MKNPSRSAALILTGLLAGTGLVSAGTPAAIPAPPAPEAESPISSEVSVGYDTFYIFRGEELFEQVVWGQVSVDIALGEKLSLNLTPWYLSGIDDDYTELDLLASLTYDAGFVEITGGYAGYLYPRGSFGGNEGIDDEHEATLGLAKSFGPFEVSTLAAYNFDREGTYLEAGVGASFEICKYAALEPSVAVGYSSNYFAEDGFTHVLLTLALPIKLTETATLRPYVAGNIPLEVLEETQDAEIFGGVSLAVSF
ncbi:MAG: hypothetical protein JWL81_225 [Verrucomicrobiales bacterium]|nr:hypothetical protein [Verrucomicrobiales bacterium]